jgi:chromosome segregation ATPase
LPGAKDKLKKAEGELKEVDRHSDAVRDELAKLRNAIKSAAQSLAEVAERIETSQPSDSPFGQARAACLAAKSEYQAKIDEIGNSTEYKQAYAEAVASNNRAVLMPAIKKRYLDDDPAVVALRERLTQTKAAYEKLQQELFARTPEYGRADQTLDRAKDEENKAEKQLRDATGKLTAAKRALAAQQAAVNNMDGALHRDKDALKKIPGLRDKLARQLENDRRERQRIR